MKKTWQDSVRISFRLLNKFARTKTLFFLSINNRMQFSSVKLSHLALQEAHQEYLTLDYILIVEAIVVLNLTNLMK